MPVETLGQAFSYGWRVTARCAAGQQDGMSRHKECVYRADLDTETLVWTRGKGFLCLDLKAACADPPNPPSSPSTASLSGSQGVGIATLIFRYFLRYFSSPTLLARAHEVIE
jgi:hypothetical protein